jgi:hypothetical protein
MAIFTSANWVVTPTADGFGGACDFIATQRIAGLTINVEVKNQERLQIPSWLRQADGGVLAFKCGGEWYACLPLADFTRLV